jgi:hypothetical protein
MSHTRLLRFVRVFTRLVSSLGASDSSDCTRLAIMECLDDRLIVWRGVQEAAANRDLNTISSVTEAGQCDNTTWCQAPDSCDSDFSLVIHQAPQRSIYSFGLCLRSSVSIRALICSTDARSGACSMKIFHSAIASEFRPIFSSTIASSR